MNGLQSSLRYHTKFGRSTPSAWAAAVIADIALMAVSALAVIEHYEQRSLELLEQARAGTDASYAGALLALAEAHEADPTFIRLFTVLVAESVDPEHPAHTWFVERYDRVRSGVALGFRAEQQAGRIRSDLDPELLSRQVIAMFAAAGTRR